jgi:hypothetical protein
MRHIHPPTALLLVALITSAGSAACSSDATTPTSPTGSEAPAAITTPVSVSFPGAVGPGGTVSRTFYAQIPGTAVAAVSGISPATALAVGLGVPRADGTGCLLAHSSTATSGTSAEVSGPVAVGTYCVQVFAPAQSAGSITFTVTLAHP